MNSLRGFCWMVGFDICLVFVILHDLKFGFCGYLVFILVIVVGCLWCFACVNIWFSLLGLYDLLVAVYSGICR